MDISCEYLLRYSLKFLKYSGGFGETPNQTFAFFALLFYSCSGIPQLLPVYQAKDNGEILQKFSLPLQFISTFIKASLYFKNRNKFFELIFSIDYIPDFLAPKGVKHEIMGKVNKRYAKLWKIYSGNVWIGMINVWLLTILSKEIYMQADFGIEKRYDNPMYWIVSTFIFIGSMFGATMAMTMDSLPAGIYCGIMMRIQVLQNYVEQIGTRKVKDKHKFDQLMIKKATIEHAKITDYVRKAESTFNGVLLVQIILSFIIISTALFQMSGVR